ncbi:hypothetical protein T492DRAFT_871585 [Pavlovales sp. CCMP2436]|nr:hypothetical protein T492DRAFT_871585 [Pavlovales sp. CCMP2436]
MSNAVDSMSPLSSTSLAVGLAAGQPEKRGLDDAELEGLYEPAKRVATARDDGRPARDGTEHAAEDHEMKDKDERECEGKRGHVKDERDDVTAPLSPPPNVRIKDVRHDEHHFGHEALPSAPSSASSLPLQPQTALAKHRARRLFKEDQGTLERRASFGPARRSRSSSPAPSNASSARSSQTEATGSRPGSPSSAHTPPPGGSEPGTPPGFSPPGSPSRTPSRSPPGEPDSPGMGMPLSPAQVCMASSKPTGKQLPVKYNADVLSVLAKLAAVVIFGAKENAKHLKACVEGSVRMPRNPLMEIDKYATRDHSGTLATYSHEYKRGKDVIEMGREFSVVQTLRRPVRGLCFGGLYTEFDVPTLMLTWAARKYGLELPALRKYVVDRASCKQLICDTTEWGLADTDKMGATKNLFVRVCFGGGTSSLEAEMQCRLMGEGKRFVQGVVDDVLVLKAAFVADLPFYAYYMSRDTKTTFPDADGQARRMFSLVLQDAEFEAVEEAITGMGLVTGIRIFDALYVETETVPADPSSVLSAMWRAANERCEDYFKQEASCLFEKTPLAFTCVPLVKPSLADFVLEQTGVTLAAVVERVSPQKDHDIAFWKAFANANEKRLVKDINDDFLSLEAANPELEFGWGCYVNNLRVAAHHHGDEMWYGDRPNSSEIALSDVVFDTLTNETRPFNSNDLFVAKLALDYATTEARDRVLGRLALACLACKGNFRKKALVLVGGGNNGKSGLISIIKLVFETVVARGSKRYPWTTEGTTANMFANTNEINVTLAEALMSKINIIEEAGRVNPEALKIFTGGWSTGIPCRLPYESSTQHLKNHCTAVFASNGLLTTMYFRVTNYPSPAECEARVKVLIAEARRAVMVANEHSKSEARKWQAAVRRGVLLAPFEAEAMAHHLHLVAHPEQFDEAQARKSLASTHRVGDMDFAENIKANKNLLTHFFMHFAKLRQNYEYHGKEASLVPLESDTVAEALVEVDAPPAPPETLEEKVVFFLKTELVYDAMSAVFKDDMKDAVTAWLARHGEPRPSGNDMVLERLIKNTMSNPKYNNRMTFARVALREPEADEPVAVDASGPAAVDAAFDAGSANETRRVDEARKAAARKAAAELKAAHAAELKAAALRKAVDDLDEAAFDAVDEAAFDAVDEAAFDAVDEAAFDAVDEAAFGEEEQPLGTYDLLEDVEVLPAVAGKALDAADALATLVMVE